MKICSVWGCDKPLKGNGYCHTHNTRFNKYGTIELPIKDKKRNHPFYMLWFERKQSNLLCKEWLDFWNFVEGVSPKPEGNFILIRLRKEPYGPNNFEWREHLKRKENESKKEWWARKWKARQAQNPGMERARNFKRKYSLTIDQYNKLLEKQNFVCKICEEKETSIDAKSGTVKRLSVDHCHNSNKIRGLLCWRCNGTLGKINDDVELLKKMITYLET